MLDLAALVVGHHTDAADCGAGNDHIALVERAVLHQQRRHRTAGLVEPRLDDHALGRAVGVGLELQHIRGQQHHLQQRLDAVARLGGDGADDGVAAVLLRDELVLHDLLLDALRVGARLIHLVDGHNDGDLRGLGVVDGLDGLRHDAVVCGHHQDGHIGTHGAAGAHGGEGLVARRVQEGDLPAAHIDGVGADVLGDAAGLCGGHIGLAHRVEQARLAVVDMAHDHHHRAAGDELGIRVLVVVDQAVLDGHDHLFFHLTAKVHGDEGGGVVVDGLAQGGHDAHLHQRLDHLGAGLFHPGGQLAHRDLLRNVDGERGLFGDLQLEPAHLLLLLAALLAADKGALLFVVLPVSAGEPLLAALVVLYPL